MKSPKRWFSDAPFLSGFIDPRILLNNMVTFLHLHLQEAYITVWASNNFFNNVHHRIIYFFLTWRWVQLTLTAFHTWINDLILT